MKIGIVLYPTFGGSGIVATELGKALSRKGHEIHFITYSQPVRLDRLRENIYFHEVRISDYPLFDYTPYEQVLTSKLVDVVRFEKLDLLHVHYAIPHAYAAYMAKLMLREEGIDIKVVTTLHGSDITLVGSHPTYQTAAEFSINHSDVVTAVSESLKEDTLRLFHIQKDIQVVYNFIDIKKYEREKKKECKRIALAQPNERILTHVSNFRPVKKTEDVVKIFAVIQASIPSKLLMVGDGPERLKTERLAKKLGVEDQVIFLGNSTELNKILCYSDVFLLPSERESFGLAALEAMAAETPVISTNTGGLSEVNKHGVTGFLSNVGDVKSMTNHVLNILESDENLATFKRNAKHHSLQFSLDKIIPVYENIYSAALHPKKV